MRLVKWAARKVVCLGGFHDFSNTSIPHFLVCQHCPAYRKVSSY